VPMKPISRSRFKSVSASTSHASRRTAREQTSQLHASSLLKMTFVAKRFIQPFQQHPMGARSQLASKSEGRNLSWCGNTVNKAVAAIKLEKRDKVLADGVGSCGAATVSCAQHPSLVQCLLDSQTNNAAERCC
jgi:hypothetical protein